MNEENFNISLRKFLKRFGVTAQREIETAVRAALESGRLEGTETLTARAVVKLELVGLEETIEGEITLGEAGAADDLRA
jgi:hypothetical protein